jgi:hypothetical protein
MKKITNILLLFLAVFAFNSCSEETEGTEDLNYIAFESNSLTLGVDIGGTAEHEVKVYTTQIMGSDRVFPIVVREDATTADAQAYNIPASVTVPANSNEGTFTVGLADVNVGKEGKSVVVDFTNEEGWYTGDPTTLNIAQICPFNEITIRFVFDGYASETSWDIVDSDGNIVAEGGGDWADGTPDAITTACLQDGEYTFTVYDVYGDGLSYPANGSVTVTHPDGTELVYIEGNFGASASETFTL